MSYSPELNNHNKSKIKFKLDLSNYATKSDSKEAAGIDTSIFAKRADLASLKLDVDDLDIYKLKTVPVDLNKLSNVVKNNVVRKSVYDELVKKFNTIQTIDTSDLI